MKIIIIAMTAYLDDIFSDYKEHIRQNEAILFKPISYDTLIHTINEKCLIESS